MISNRTIIVIVLGFGFLVLVYYFYYVGKQNNNAVEENAEGMDNLSNTKLKVQYWQDGSNPPYWLQYFVNNHNRIMQLPVKERRIVVWKCWPGCSGLGDQLKSLGNAFWYALLDNRAFFIDVAGVSHYRHVQSYLYDWVWKPEYGGLTLNDTFTMSPLFYFPTGNWTGVNNSSVIFMYPPYFLVFPTILENKHYTQVLRNKFRLDLDFKCFDKVDVSIYRSNVSLYQYFCSPAEKIIGQTLNFLIAPAPPLYQRLINFIQENMTGKSVGVHIRWGGAKKDGFGKIGDGRLAFQDEEDYSWFLNCTMLYANQVDKVFVTTDYVPTFDDFKAVVGPSKVVYTPGTPRHLYVDAAKLRWENESIAEGEIKGWLDHFLLAETDTSIVTWSGFSRLAIHRRWYCPHIYVNNPRLYRQEIGTPCNQEHLFPNKLQSDPIKGCSGK